MEANEEIHGITTMQRKGRFMGYGKTLKAAANAKGVSIRKLALETGVSPGTLYTSIRRDTGLRYDIALRVALYLGIRPDQICNHADFTTIFDGNRQMNVLMDMIREDRRNAKMKHCVETMMCCDFEHLQIMEEVLERMQKMDLADCILLLSVLKRIKTTSGSTQRRNRPEDKEAGMDWRKELKETAGVSEEDAVDLTDMEEREILGEQHLERMKNTGNGDRKEGD